MATRYVLMETVINKANKMCYKPNGTLGHHCLQYKEEKGRLFVRGIGKTYEEPVSLEDRVYSVEELMQLPQKDGRFIKEVTDELSPWMQVKRSDVLRYNCGKVEILRGKFASLKRDELLDKPGAKEALQNYLQESLIRRLSKGTGLSQEAVSQLQNMYGGHHRRFTITRVTSPLNEVEIPEDDSYTGYRLALQYPGWECLECTENVQNIPGLRGSRVWVSKKWGIDPHNNAWGYQVLETEVSIL